MSSTDTTPAKKRILWVLTGLITLLLLVICLFVVEAVLKGIGLGNPLVYEDNKAYGYAPLPNQVNKRLRDSVVTVNASGLRSVQDWNMPGDYTRILFLGDSVTWGGTYIDDKQTFSTLVCDGMGPQYICGNGGVNAYGVLNMALRSRYDNRLQSADIVIFNVIIGDFLRGLQDSNVAHYFLHKPQGSFPAIQEAVSYLAAKYNVNRLLSKRQDPPADPKLYEAGQIGAVEFAIETLNAEIERLEAEGKRVMVFYSPAAREARKTPWDPVFQKIKDTIVSKVNNIRDMTDVFGPQVEINYYDAVHYEVNGHKVAADYMIRELSDLRIPGK